MTTKITPKSVARPLLALGLIAVLTAGIAHAQLETTAQPIVDPLPSSWPTGIDAAGVLYPATGQVTADELRVRAGNNQNFYVCGELPQDAEVVVVDKRLDWLKIEPPKGFFSLIAADFVKSVGETGEGLVIGKNVRVRAGAHGSKDNSAVQCKLNKQDKVKILGTVESSLEGKKTAFYKIVPPKGKAFFWVSAKYVRYLGPVGAASVPDLNQGDEPPPTDLQSKQARELLKLDQALLIEMERPVGQRRLAELQAKYLNMRGETESPELLAHIDKQIVEIDQQIAIQADLEKARLLRGRFHDAYVKLRRLLESHGQEGKKVMQFVGLLKPSHVFGAPGLKRWRLVDPESRTNICYAVPGKVAEAEIAAKEGKVVTITGPGVLDLRLYQYLVVVDKIGLGDDRPEPK